MTDKKRKIIGNLLVFLALIVAALIYCRPVPLSALGGWDADEPVFPYLSYEVNYPDRPGQSWETYTAQRPEDDPAAQEDWDALVESIRVYRMPLNWLGRFYPGRFTHQLWPEGKPIWRLNLICDEGAHVQLCFYNDRDMVYSNGNGELPCTIANKETVCAQIDALMEQYGVKQ